MEIPHINKSGSKYLQPMLKKSSHNHNYNQTNPKPQTKPKTKPKKQPPEKTFTQKIYNNNQNKKNVVKSYSKSS
jgi:hypothetical protein